MLSNLNTSQLKHTCSNNSISLNLKPCNLIFLLLFFSNFITHDIAGCWSTFVYSDVSSKLSKHALFKISLSMDLNYQELA